MGWKNEILKQLAEGLLAKEEHGLEGLTEARVSACNSCEELLTAGRQCGVCKCFVDVKAKFQTNRDPELGGKTVITHCPLGKWGDRALANLYRGIKGQALIEAPDQ